MHSACHVAVLDSCTVHSETVDLKKKNEPLNHGFLWYKYMAII